MVDLVLAVYLSISMDQILAMQLERVLQVKEMLDMRVAVLMDLRVCKVAVVVLVVLLLTKMVAQVRTILHGLRLVAILPAVAVVLMERPVLAVEATEHPTRQVLMELPTQVVEVVEPQQVVELTMAAMVDQE
jgi:hypothetical protein